MTRFERASLILIAVGLAAASSSAQTVKKGTVSGTVVSATATAPSGGSVVLLMTTPPTGSFLLTQLCVRGTPGANNGDQAFVDGSSIGRLAVAFGDGVDGDCTSWTPGLAIPAGESLSCVQDGASASPAYCTVTGIQAKK